METHNAIDIEQSLVQSLTAAIQSNAEIENQIEAVLVDKGSRSSGKHDDGLRRASGFRQNPIAADSCGT